MARLQGISGGMSGRTGSFTYRQSRGQTIVSQYQPLVKNPNTEGQQDQRAKFKLMSQLAAIMAPGFGTMGVTKRPGKQRPTQRNAFMQLNMPLVEVDSSADNSVVAKIQMNAIQLTSSFVELGSITATDDSGDLSVVVANVPMNVEYVQFALIKANANSAPTLLRVERVQRSTSSQTDFGIDFTAQDPGNYTVLAFGLIPTDGNTSNTLDNIFNPSTSLNDAAIQLNQLVSSGSLSETKTVGVNVVAS